MGNPGILDQSGRSRSEGAEAPLWTQSSPLLAKGKESSLNGLDVDETCGPRHCPGRVRWRNTVTMNKLFWWWSWSSSPPPACGFYGRSSWVVSALLPRMRHAHE